jgi:osmotically-inducible protein OsmY
MAAAFLELLMAVPSRYQGDGAMDLLLSPDSATAETTADPPSLGRKIEDLLWCSGYLALRYVTCVASGEMLYLSGSVPSYYLKQIAQEIAAGVEGVNLVINSIQVTTPRAQPLAGRDQTTTQAPWSA